MGSNPILGTNFYHNQSGKRELLNRAFRDHPVFSISPTDPGRGILEPMNAAAASTSTLCNGKHRNSNRTDMSGLLVTAPTTAVVTAQTQNMGSRDSIMDMPYPRAIPENISGKK